MGSREQSRKPYQSRRAHVGLPLQWCRMILGSNKKLQLEKIKNLPLTILYSMVQQQTISLRCWRKHSISIYIMRKLAFKYCGENSFVYPIRQLKSWNQLGLFFRLFVEKKASTNPVTITIIDLNSAFYNLCKNKLIEETIFISKKTLVLKYIKS